MTTSNAVRFFVRGVPVTQGSTRAFVVKGRPVITSTSKGLRAWRDLVAAVAQHNAPPLPWEGPVGLAVTFYLPRPKSEPKRRRTLPDRKPDLDKVTRAIGDALTGIFWRDDAQVVDIGARKRWADDPQDLPRDRQPPGVDVKVGRVLLGDEAVHATWDALLGVRTSADTPGGMGRSNPPDPDVTPPARKGGRAPVNPADVLQRELVAVLLGDKAAREAD